MIRNKENRKKANDDQNANWDDAHNLDSFFVNANANLKQNAKFEINHIEKMKINDMWEAY